MVLRVSLFLSLLLCSACFSNRGATEPLIVFGEIVDNHTGGPVSAAKVSLRFPKSFSWQHVETDRQGRFSISSGAPWDKFLSEADAQSGTEITLRLSVEHSDYQVEEMHDDFIVQTSIPPKVDLGSVYLDRK